MKLALPLVLALMLGAGPALANEFCNQELAPLVKEREEIQARLERINKNPQADGARERFCSTMASFITNLRKTETYMTANQDFCQIPGEAIEGLKNGIANATRTRRRICVAQQQAPAQAKPGQPALPKPPVELKLR